MEKNENVPKNDNGRSSIWKQYLEWVSMHPNVALEMETAFKWISYLVTGKNPCNCLEGEIWKQIVSKLLFTK